MTWQTWLWEALLGRIHLFRVPLNQLHILTVCKHIIDAFLLHKTCRLVRKRFNFMLKFWGTKTFGMKKFPRKNRVVQGDRVIEGRVIEGDYCSVFIAMLRIVFYQNNHGFNLVPVFYSYQFGTVRSNLYPTDIINIRVTWLNYHLIALIFIVLFLANSE